MPGNCSQKVMKWFYDVNTKYCRQFEFTGCNGNENRFETRQQCIEICESHKRRGMSLKEFVMIHFERILIILVFFSRKKKYAIRTRSKDLALKTYVDGIWTRRLVRAKNSDMAVRQLKFEEIGSFSMPELILELNFI